mmetsp:Transcript_95370/g.294180  ORF Transcript_95370/g.294180 Transcript_95370/m.294180 type:complete len:326 (+) Transcript_95370:154-1131(+)
MLALGLFSCAAACSMVQSFCGSHLRASLFRLFSPCGIFPRGELSTAFFFGLPTLPTLRLCPRSLAFERLLRTAPPARDTETEFPFAAPACDACFVVCGERTFPEGDAPLDEGLLPADRGCSSPSVRSMMPNFMISLTSSRLIVGLSVGSRFALGSFFAAISRCVEGSRDVSRFTFPFMRIHASTRSTSVSNSLRSTNSGCSRLMGIFLEAAGVFCFEAALGLALLRSSCCRPVAARTLLEDADASPRAASSAACRFSDRPPSAASSTDQIFSGAQVLPALRRRATKLLFAPDLVGVPASTDFLLATMLLAAGCLGGAAGLGARQE